MFDQLSARLEKVLKFVRGEGKITEKNMAEALRMIRLALLEADVNYKVVKELIERIQAKALDQRVLQNTPLLVSFDLKRPAAQEQLQMIAGQLGLPFYEMSREQMASPQKALKDLIIHTRNRGYDPLIVDTAGRLHIDEDLMKELRLVKEALQPTEIISVGEAMTGQDAGRSAQAFEEKIALTSVILTKLEGDARGGAALSIVTVTGKPIKFVGTGEKFDKLEVFHPERMASRILGMGDILSLIEKAEEEGDVP